MEWLQYLQKVCKEKNVDTSRVQYVGKLTGERSEYVAESADLIKRFMEFYKIKENVHILFDGGRSYKVQKENIFDILGYKHHLEYPSAVHQYISPNDNCWHGVAKRKWTNMSLDWSDDVLSTVTLLQLLDNVDSSTIRGYFLKNMLSCKDEADVLEVIAPLTKKIFSENVFYRSALHKYWTLYNPSKLAESSIGGDYPISLESTFDGTYWTEWTENKNKKK